MYFELEFLLLRGSVFIKFLDLRPPFICFLIFWKSRGSFFSSIFGFWKFQNCILNQNSYFWGVCFIKIFDLRPPYICFLFFGILGVFFWVWFLGFENFEIVFWIRIPIFWGGLFYETFWFEASLSTGDDFIDSSGIIFLVPFLATKETLVPLANDPIM